MHPRAFRPRSTLLRIPLPRELAHQRQHGSPKVRAQLDSGVDVAADRLAVHAGQLADRSLTLATQPLPQDISYFEHANLPERHAAS
ncbi:MAG: hypothetical protein IT195_06585 [Microthrixaceae bacterium]|nr:hypothetical protein [Microthrixaceae bacterium]